MFVSKNFKILFKFIVLLLVLIVAMFELHKKDRTYGVSVQKKEYNNVVEQRDLNNFLYDFNLLRMFVEEETKKDKEAK